MRTTWRSYPDQTPASIRGQVTDEIIGVLTAAQLDDPYNLMAFRFRYAR